MVNQILVDLYNFRIPPHIFFSSVEEHETSGWSFSEYENTQFDCLASKKGHKSSETIPHAVLGGKKRWLCRWLEAILTF